jgi:hypothetical protein
MTNWATRLCSGFLLSAPSLCLYLSLSLCVFFSPVYLSISPKPYLKYACLLTGPPACLPACPSISLTPFHSLSGKKFPVVEAHFWLNKLFYIIGDRKVYFN